MKHHSPGPFAHSGTIVRTITASDGTTIANTVGAAGGLTDQQDEANARVLSAADDLLNVAEGFEVRGPDADGDVWLWLTGRGIGGRGGVNLGPAGGILGQAGLALEAERAAAVAKATL